MRPPRREGGPGFEHRHARSFSWSPRRSASRVVLWLVLATSFWAPACDSLEVEQALGVAASVFRDKGLGQMVAVLCSQRDAVLWERAFAEGSTYIATPRVTSSPTASVPDVVQSLQAARAPVGVFVNVGCHDAKLVLRKASGAHLLGGRLHWVIAGNASASRVDLERLADTLDLGPDSEVTLAVRSTDLDTVHLVDAYRAEPGTRGPGRPLLTQLTATWRRPTGLNTFVANSAAVRRRDLSGAVLRAGVLVSGFREADLDRVLGKPKDNHPVVSPVAAFSHVLTMHLRDMLNVTLRLQAGSFFSLLRRVGRGELHLISTASDMEARYWDALDYTALPLWAERRVLMLKNPGALSSYDGWLRPLDSKVWVIMVLLILATAVVLRAVGYWEVKFDLGHVEEEDSWASAVTTAISMVCAQGFTTTTSWTSSRTLLLMFEFFSLFLNLFYTSGIVTFLLTFPPPYARSVRQVIDSPFAVAVDRDVFSRDNFTESRDPLMRELYDKKIGQDTDDADGRGFMSLREAANLTRDSRVALAGSPFPMYVLMARTWSQSDTCRFLEIPLRPPTLLALGTAKGSPFREILNQGILLLAERGLVARERIRWSVLRPRCTLSDVTELDYVGLRQVTPLLCFLGGGLILSSVIIALELAHSKWGARKNPVIDLLKDLTKSVSDPRKKAA